MNAEPSPLVLTIPSDPCQLAQVRDFVLCACRDTGLDGDAAHGLALAVHEAVRNVIRHAHQEQMETPLVVQCHCCADRVEVHILDEGEPFDITAVPDLDPAEMRVGGRGIFLMRKLTDQITCERRGDRGNVLRLVKHRAPGTPPCQRS